ERGRHVGADGLAFRPRRAFARAALEFGDHGGVFDRRRIDIANAGFRHRGNFSQIIIVRGPPSLGPLFLAAAACCRKRAAGATPQKDGLNLRAGLANSRSGAPPLMARGAANWQQPFPFLNARAAAKRAMRKVSRNLQRSVKRLVKNRYSVALQHSAKSLRAVSN